MSKEDACRICLESGAFISLFDGGESDDNKDVQLASKFSSVTSLQVSPTDDLPKMLCSACSARLQDAYKLKEQATQSEQKLKDKKKSSLKKAKTKVQQDDTTKIEVELDDIKVEADILDSEGNDADVFDDSLQIKNEDIFDAESNYEPTLSDNVLSTKRKLKYKDESEREKRMKKKLKRLKEKECGAKREKELLTCNIPSCLETVNSKFAMKSHKWQVHGLVERRSPNKGMFECSVCLKRYRYWDTLNRHSIKFHDTPVPSVRDKFSCDECGLKFRHRNYYKKHMKAQHNKIFRVTEINKGGVCQVCGKYVEEFLDKHERLHVTGIVNKHKCEYCQKLFRSKAVLTDHLRVHTQERPFHCGSCTKTFKYKYGLQIHELAHNDVYDFVCDICKRCFKKKQVFTAHRLTHFGVRPYACQVCDKTYTLTSGVKLHCQKLHPELTLTRFQDYGYKVPLPNLDEKDIVIKQKPRNYMRGKIVFAHDGELPKGDSLKA